MLSFRCNVDEQDRGFRRAAQPYRRLGQAAKVIAPSESGFGESGGAGREVCDPESSLGLHEAKPRAGVDRVVTTRLGGFVLSGFCTPDRENRDRAFHDVFIQWDIPPNHGIWRISEAAPLRMLAEPARRGLYLKGATAEAVWRRLKEMAAVIGLARLAVFFQIIARLVEAPVGDIRTLTGGRAVRGDASARQETMWRALNHLSARHCEPVALSEMLKITDMSPATFAREFKRYAGKSLSELRNQARLEAVCRGLRNTAEPVSVIAYKHGFNHLSFFNRLFRREVGLSPTAYRARSRGVADAIGSSVVIGKRERLGPPRRAIAAA